MKKTLVILAAAITVLSFTVLGKPAVSSYDGIIKDSGVRETVTAKTFTNKIKFLKGTELKSLGESKGKLKGTVWGQYIVIKVKNPYGKWVESEYALYVVEDYYGNVTFAGLDDE